MDRTEDRLVDRKADRKEGRLVDPMVGQTEGQTEGRSGDWTEDHWVDRMVGRWVDPTGEMTAVGWMGAEVVLTKPLIVALVVLQEPRVVLQQEVWAPALPQRRGG